ncbi:MAG: alpha/beta fold hydrolase [Culicoidibacterales bacterium]
MERAKIFIDINNSKQGMIMQYEDINKPVLLFIHGGPGSTSYIFFESLGLELYQQFVVCHWEQRGAGISYAKDIPIETMNSQQIIDDARVLSHYLMKTYKKAKIFLMGHSWGTFIGMQLAEQHAELFYAYIGIGQINNQVASEKAAYSYMLNQAVEMKDNRALKQLSKYSPNDPDFPTMKYLMSARNTYLQKYNIGLTRKKMSMMTAVLLPLLRTKTYSLTEKINQIRGLFFSMKMFGEVFTVPLDRYIKKIDIPVYIIAGAYDYQTSFTQAKILFDQLDIPKGEYIVFEHSAHSPLFEEPEKFLQTMATIVRAVLADDK